MQQLRLPESSPSGIEVWRLDLDLAAPVPDADWALLSEDERVRALRLRKHEDRVRSVVTRAVLRRLLGSRLRQAPHRLRFVSNRYGKPRLSSEAGVDFNVSHAGAFALIALSKNGAVGVDIERCTPEIDEASLATQVLSPFERELGADMQPDFFERWVVKESVLKALGLGVAEHLQSLTVLKEGSGAGQRYHLRHTCTDWSGLEAWALEGPTGYAAALARADHRYGVCDDTV